MDRTDDHIRDAVKIGESNQRVVELARNWCSHLEVVKSGGTGLIELETGLPIGMRHFKCPHATAAGLAGMHLKDIVLDFYDRNCDGCKQRIPVRLPNLIQLVAERDQHIQRSNDAQSRAALEEQSAIELRAERRKVLSAGCGPAISAVFGAIDKFDREPTEQNTEILRQLEHVARIHFVPTVQDALWDLSDAVDVFRSEAALQLLDGISSDRRRLCRSSLRFLSVSSSRVAAGVVSQHLDAEDHDLIPFALPALIEIAAPAESFFGSSAPGIPGPLLAAYRIAPSEVRTALVDALAHPDKHLRIAAVKAILLIAELEPAFGLALAPELLSSLQQPDDHYGPEGSADTATADALASIMTRFPHEVDNLVADEIVAASEDDRPAYYKIYRRLLRSRDIPQDEAEAEEARGLAYARCMDMLVCQPKGPLLHEALDFARHEAGKYPKLLDPKAETLIGAMALYASEQETPSSPLLNLDLRPDPLQAMEAASRRMTLGYILDAMTDLVGASATRNPESVGVSLLETLGKLGDSHALLKAGLVECLGRLGSERRSLPPILPPLYQAMTDRAQRVRAAAVRAYGKIAATNPEDLPMLLHETFLLSLRDPFVIVQWAGIEALGSITLPPPLMTRANASVLLLIDVYNQTDVDDRLVTRAIEVFLGTRSRSKPLPDQIREFLLDTVSRLDSYEAAGMLLRYTSVFRGSAKFPELLVKLIGDPDTSEYNIKDLLECLAECSVDELRRVADSIPGAVKSAHVDDFEVADRAIELLTMAGALSSALLVARDQTEVLDETVWSRPRKLRCRLRQTAVEIEIAAASGVVKDVERLTNQWRTLEKEITADEEENKKKRSPFFGLPISDRNE